MADDYEQGLPTPMANQSINEIEPAGGASSSAMKRASRPLDTDFHSGEVSSDTGLDHPPLAQPRGRVFERQSV